nr:hypothetical protein K-LCC10_0458 [Kaumoebavirus]
MQGKGAAYAWGIFTGAITASGFYVYEMDQNNTLRYRHKRAKEEWKFDSKRSNEIIRDLSIDLKELRAENKKLSLIVSETNGFTPNAKRSCINKLKWEIATDIAEAIHPNFTSKNLHKAKERIANQIEENVKVWVEDVVAKKPYEKTISSVFRLDKYSYRRDNLEKIYAQYISDFEDAKKNGLYLDKKVTIAPYKAILN